MGATAVSHEKNIIRPLGNFHLNDDKSDQSKGGKFIYGLIYFLVWHDHDLKPIFEKNFLSTMQVRNLLRLEII